MDSKFIITRERRALRPGDIFAWSLRSPFIRRFVSSDGCKSYFVDIRYYDRDVNVPFDTLIDKPFGYICKTRI